MARRIENADGMFPIERIDPRDITPADLQAAVNRLNEQLDLVKTLAAIELDAKARVRSSNDTIRNYAEAVLSYIWGIRQFIEKGGDIGTALAYALSVGQLDERMGQIERFEPKVIASTRSRKGSKAGCEARKAQGKRDDFFRDVDERIKKRGSRKTPSDTTIVKRAGKTCGIGERQAWRIWKEYSEQKK
jgi:hypothetical protein